MDAETAPSRTSSPAPHLAPTRLPDSTIQLQLISDIGPELVQRWTESGTCLRKPSTLTSSSSSKPKPPATVIPGLFRALISAVLRASSRDEADDFMSSYRTLITQATIPVFDGTHNNGAVLGFFSQSAALRTSIWHDLMHSAVRDTALQSVGPALSFYSTAGAGAGDSSEYYDVMADGRVDDFVVQAEYEYDGGLDSVRAYARSLVIQHVFAQAVCTDTAGTLINDCLTRYGAHGFYAPIVDALPMATDYLPHHSTTAIHDFYHAVYQRFQKPQHKQLHHCDDFRRRLITGLITSAALEKPHVVLPFLMKIPNAHLRLKIARSCVALRFNVDDKTNDENNNNNNTSGNAVARHTDGEGGTSSSVGGLTWTDIGKKFLSVRPAQGRPNAALPAFLAALVSSWCVVTQPEDIAVRRRSTAQKQMLKLKQTRDRNWNEFGGPASDVQALQLALSQFGHILMVALNNHVQQAQNHR